MQNAGARLRAAAGRLLLVGVTPDPVDPLPDPAAADALPGPGVNLDGSLPASPGMPVSPVSSSAVSFPPVSLPPGPLDVAPLLPSSPAFNTNRPVDLSGLPLANYVQDREKQQKPLPDSSGSGSGSVGVPPLATLATLLPHAQQLPFTGASGSAAPCQRRYRMVSSIKMPAVAVAAPGGVKGGRGGPGSRGGRGRLTGCERHRLAS